MVSFPSHPSPILWMTQWHNHVLSPYHIPFPHIAKIMGPKFIIGVFSISAQPATSQLNLKLHFYRENLGKKIKKNSNLVFKLSGTKPPKKSPPTSWVSLTPWEETMVESDSGLDIRKLTTHKQIQNTWLIFVFPRVWRKPCRNSMKTPSFRLCLVKLW